MHLTKLWRTVLKLPVVLAATTSYFKTGKGLVNLKPSFSSYKSACQSNINHLQDFYILKLSWVQRYSIPLCRKKSCSTNSVFLLPSETITLIQKWEGNTHQVFKRLRTKWNKWNYKAKQSGAKNWIFRSTEYLWFPIDLDQKLCIQYIVLRVGLCFLAAERLSWTPSN